VVPGHTPFLISNAVLGKLQGIVDVADKRLGFKGCNDWIPLFEVRKNLLGVKVLDLLMKTPKLRTRAQTHILCTHEVAEGGNRSQSHAHDAHLHEETHEKHGGIQILSETFPKESVFPTLHNSKSSDPAASLLSKKEVITGGSRSVCSPDSQHGHGGQGELPAEEPHITSGSFTAREHNLSRASSKSFSSSGSGQLGGVGSGDSTVRAAPTKDLCGDLRDRPKVCEPDVEPASSCSMGRSFQLYCRHRREASIEKQKEDTINQGLQMPISPHMTPEVASLIRAGGAPWLTPRTNAQLIEQKKVRDAQKAKKEAKDWEHVEVTEVKPSKRRLPSTASTMAPPPNETKVAQLQAQIATLQRDLQIELNGTAWQPEDA
jgi:anti-sigma28 factor (negative regulator of flagellin synthesis)